MKTNIRPSQTDQGSVLMVTLIITGIIGFALASYLTLASTQNRSTGRSQTWNASIPIVEAGIEEALAHLNKNGVTNITLDGWQHTSGNFYRLRRQLGDSYYIVDIDTTTNSKPVIYSQGFVPAPLASTVPGAFVAQVSPGTIGTVSYVSRKVKVTTTLDALFSKGMVAKGQIDMNGNNVATDSFDSSDPNFSTNGLYDRNKHKDKGDVATNSGLVNSLNVGNANITGKVSTGPGGSVSVGSNGRVGSTQFMTDAAYRATHDSNSDGVEDGWSSDDMNVSFADVKAPFSGGYLTPSGGTITQLVVTVTSTTNSSGSYPTAANTSILTTNTTSVTSSTYPAASSYVGIVTTNYGSVTSASYPSTSTYRKPVTTNTTTTTTTGYPSSYIGPITTNTVSTTSDVAPLPGTYIGAVTTKFQNNKLIYTYNKISGYTYRTIASYTYQDVVSYAYNSITGYSYVQTTFSTNSTAVYYDYILRNGDYQLLGLSGKVYVSGNARLYVTGNVSLSGQDKIDIAPSNASLQLYVAGASASLGGQGVINEAGQASNFYYYGLPSNTSVSLAGNAGFTGVIYAPQATFTLSGGGNNITDFIGASVTKSVTMNGHFNFHYDENLAKIGPSRGYIVTSWNEL